MNLVIFGKIAGAILVVGTASVGVVAIVNVKNWDFANVYAISTTVSDGATEKLTDANFKCKLTSDDISKAFDCKVRQLKTENTQKQHKIGNVLVTNEATKEILKTQHNVFQITFDEQHWSNNPNHDKNIEIIHTGTEHKKYANLKQLFNVYRGEARGTTNYFVAQALKPDSTTITAANTLKCSFSNTPDDKQACTITEFSATDASLETTNNYAALTFQKPTATSATTITKNRYYLIQFPNSSDASKNIKIENFKHGNGINASTDAINAITFHKVKPVVYDSNHDHLFVI